jgi:hypothetical protein
VWLVHEHASPSADGHQLPGSCTDAVELPLHACYWVMRVHTPCCHPETPCESHLDPPPQNAKELVYAGRHGAQTRFLHVCLCLADCRRLLQPPATPYGLQPLGEA